MISNKKGFTLIELIMVIIILGILAAVAIPRYIDLSGQANDASEKGVLGGVRAGIATYLTENRVYPATLDAVATSTACSTAAACFTTVLAQGGITGDGWAKAGSTTTYTHTGSNTSTYTYVPATGSFSCTSTCP